MIILREATVRNLRITGILGTLLALAMSAAGQEFWDKKDYTQWSRDDCKRLLENSPWTGRHDVAVLIQTSARVTSQTDNANSATNDGAGSEEINYIFQFRSALPVRQAVVRMAQINNKYDKMAAEQKKAFDAQINQFLAQDVGDKVLVHVVYNSNVAVTKRALAQFWQSQTLERVRDAIFLITASGQRISPIDYQVAKGADLEFALVFPRTLNGEPLIKPSDKSLALEMTMDKVATHTTNAANSRRGGPNLSGERIFVQFKPAKMTYKGQFVF